MKNTVMHTLDENLSTLDYIMNHMIEAGLITAHNYDQAMQDAKDLIVTWELKLCTIQISY